MVIGFRLVWCNFTEAQQVCCKVMAGLLVHRIVSAASL